MSASQMSASQMSASQMSASQMPVSQMPKGQMPVFQMSVCLATVGHVSVMLVLLNVFWPHFCRPNDLELKGTEPKLHL